jgi:hypothetical protein
MKTRCEWTHGLLCLVSFHYSESCVPKPLGHLIWCNNIKLSLKGFQFLELYCLLNIQFSFLFHTDLNRLDPPKLHAPPRHQLPTLYMLFSTVLHRYHAKSCLHVCVNALSPIEMPSLFSPANWNLVTCLRLISHTASCYKAKAHIYIYIHIDKYL